MSCDVTGCSGRTHLGWRPLAERMGRKICERHWRRHKDEQDSFDLFEAFGFRRPPGIPKPAVKKDIAGCGCGRELEPGRRFCTVCAAERERQRKKRYYHDKKNSRAEPVVDENTLRCEQCGNARLPGHSYCGKCAERRNKMTRRQAQSRYWKKQHMYYQGIFLDEKVDTLVKEVVRFVFTNKGSCGY
jgi:hypothetical protein